MSIKWKMVVPHILSADITGDTNIDVVIPSEIDGVEVKEIDDSFAKTNIKSLFIPASVEIIREEAFYNCIKLEKIEIADGSQLFAIDTKAFDSCEITSFPFEKCEKLHCIHSYAFARTNIKKVDLSNTNVDYIDEGSFIHSPLEQVIFSKSLICIGSSAFEGTNIKTLDFSNSTEEDILFLKTSAFESCYRLEEIIFPKKKTCVGESAFYGCSALKEITIPKNVTIEINSFYGCISLKKVVFEAGIPTEASIPESAFEKCWKLETVIIDANYEIIGQKAFEGCCNLNEVKFPKTLTMIENEAFAGCKSLESADLRGCFMEYIGAASFDASKVSIDSIYMDYTTGVNISAEFNEAVGILSYDRIQEKYPFSNLY